VIKHRPRRIHRQQRCRRGVQGRLYLL